MNATKPYIRLQTEIPGPKSLAVLDRLRRTVARALEPLAPVVIEHAEDALVTDIDGNRMIDLTGGMGVLNVGHTPETVVRAIQQQASQFLHTDFSLIPYEVYIELAEQLLAKMPHGKQKKVAFFNTGAEAVENAVKLARKATGRTAIIAFEGAFHGRTYLAMSLTSKVKPYKHGFGPFVPGVYRAPYPYVYRCPFGTNEKEACLERSLHWLERMFVTHVAPEEVAAIIVEPVLGEGGFVVPPRGFLTGLREICSRHGVLLIVDEIQTGIGRTGKLFAIEHENVEPDILVVAKSLAAGMPLSAVIADPDIMDAANSGEIGGTYPGNPLACAAALQVLRLFDDEGLLQRANDIGEKIKTTWLEWQKHYEFIGDVRGLGAMVGVEFVQDRDSKTPDSEYLNYLIDRCIRRGVIPVKCGLYGNVLRFLAPLTITDEQLDEALSVMGEVLNER